MHELSVATAVLNTALKHAGERHISVVALRVGRMRQVVPESLRFYFEIVTRDTACEGARLELEEIEARLRCSACAHEWEPMVAAFRCPRCEDGAVEIIAGEELEVDYIEVEEEAECTAPR